jgi:hypothetical protein
MRPKPTAKRRAYAVTVPIVCHRLVTIRRRLKATLIKLAKHDRRTLSAYVEKLLENHVASYSVESKGLRLCDRRRERHLRAIITPALPEEWPGKQARS